MLRFYLSEFNMNDGEPICGVLTHLQIMLPRGGVGVEFLVG